MVGVLVNGPFARPQQREDDIAEAAGYPDREEQENEKEGQTREPVDRPESAEVQ